MGRRASPGPVCTERSSRAADAVCSRTSLIVVDLTGNFWVLQAYMLSGDAYAPSVTCIRVASELTDARRVPA